MRRQKQTAKSEFDLLCDVGGNILDLNALLLHRIAVANGNTAILLGLEIDGDAERSTDLVLTAVALADGTGIVESTGNCLASSCQIGMALSVSFWTAAVPQP